MGCTITFFYNLLIRNGKIVFITLPFEEVGLGDTIIIIGSAIFYLFCLCCGSAWRDGKRSIRDVKRSAVKMEGADGKQYLMPGDLETALEIYRDAYHKKDDPAIDLLNLRLSVLLYEEFKSGGKCVLERDPSGNLSYEAWKKLDPKEAWTEFTYGVYSWSIGVCEQNGQYQKAKGYVDHLTEIFFARKPVSSPWYDGAWLAKLREDVYSHLPDSARIKSIDQRCEELRKAAEADRERRAEELRQYEADAPKRRLEREARYYEEEERERKKKQLQAEYEAKLKKVDDWSNALASAEDGTVYNDWHDSRIPGGGVDADAYRRREFLRDEKKDQYRKEYEEALRELDDE